MRVGTSRTARAVLASAAALLLSAACKYGEVVVVQPAAAGHGPLTLSIQPDPEDSAVARELGWSGIPGAEVTISPAEADTATGPPLAVLTTDSLGAARVGDLVDGHYLVEVRRLLTADEAAKLAPTEDVVGFMGRAMVQRGKATVAAPASRRHSIVISEWAFNFGWVPGVGTYNFGGFLELANNSDTTVYLDGLVIGLGWDAADEYYEGVCAAYEPQTNDPDGVWTRFFDSLPGTGHTYSLAPGATAVIATDAIDHSGIVPGGLDLSHADFEFIGEADADNPGVPNTIDVGVESYVLGHGLYLWNMAPVTFVALPVDTATLPMTPGGAVRRIPRARVLDVVALFSTFQDPDPLCPHLVHRNFDRHPAQLMGHLPIEFVRSVERKVAYTRDGRKILQHTRSSATDFFRGWRTPGQLP